MARPRQDELAQRLAQRMREAPTKGRSPAAPQPSKARTIAPPRRAMAPRTEAAFSTPDGRDRLRRGDQGGRLRGHLVPSELHQAARRRKLTATGRTTWDDVMRSGIEQLLALDKRELDRRLTASRRQRTDDSRPRLVQATLPADLDRRFVLLQLDAGDQLPGGASYERLWSIAISLWLDHG